MSLSVPDFWKLLADSRLLAPLHIQQLTSQFDGVKQPSQPTAKSLAQWLVAQKAVSRYQAAVLLAGKAGPFFYGDYKVVARVEQGPLAGCFRAQHTSSGHPVLLRFLTGSIINDNGQWQSAVHATQQCLGIRSPQVQRYFELVDLPKFKFLVSEDLRGTTLAEKLVQERIPAPEACRLSRLAALGLAAMHAADRTHGDLRTGNVLLEETTKQPGGVKLLYDPIREPAALDLSETDPKSRLAVMADYLAPELWTPGRAPDPLADIYALGCVLYAMLTGKPPFAEGDIAQKLAGHTTQPIKPLEPYGVPQPLAQLVTYLLAKNPSVRYASAELVAEQLALFIEPAAHRWQPPPAPATLRTYEQAINRASPSQATAAMPRSQTPAPSQVVAPFVLGNQALSAQSTTPASATVASTLDIQVQPSSRAGRSADEILRRRKQQRQRNLVIGLAVSCLALAAAAGGGLWWSSQQRNNANVAAVPVTAQSEAVVTPASANGENHRSSLPTTGNDGDPNAKSTATAVGNQQVIPDDGRLLWASPTSGPPISFRCVPPEAQVFIVIRPADMLADKEGQRVLTALGPQVASERAAFEEACGFQLADIEQLIVTLHNNDAKFPRTSFVVEARQPHTRDELVSKWGNPTAVKEKEETYYTGTKWSFYIPSSPDGERTFAMGEARDIKEVAVAAGAPPAVFREIERLRRTTDDRRHVTLLLYPQFLFNDDGAPLFAAERAKLKQPLSWLLGDHLQAAAASCHFGEASFIELRMLSSLDKEPYALVDELRSRLDKVPASLEDYFVSLEPPPYWKKLAFRFPGMVQELHSQLRIGVENDQAVMNAVLPATAPHNLALGTELLVATAPGHTLSASAAPAASGPKTLTDALQLKISFSFDSQSLEFAMRDLADEVKGNLKGAPFEFAIKIIGDDLKLEGITRNQSIRDFKQENQSVADILTALVRKANTVTTVTDPSQKDQKLVWVIGPDPDDPARQAVLITTRVAAATKKYTLPAPFVAKLK